MVTSLAVESVRQSTLFGKCVLMQIDLYFQSRQQTPVHLVASRQTGTATSILRALLSAAGKDIRLKEDSVSKQCELSLYSRFSVILMAYWIIGCFHETVCQSPIASND